MYGIYLNKTNLWYRGVLKFVRKDHVPVLSLVDTYRVVDYNQNQMRAKKIQDKGLQDMPFGEFKMVIYGVATWDNDDEEYGMIFDELLKEKVVTGIFGLIEKKENRIHECFAGDLLFMFNEQYKSFREVIIKERITYPSRVKEVLNQQLVMARTEFFMTKNRNLSTDVSVRIYEISIFCFFFINHYQFFQLGVTFVGRHSNISLNVSGIDTAEEEPLEVIHGYNLYEILGEGSFGKN